MPAPSRTQKLRRAIEVWAPATVLSLASLTLLFASIGLVQHWLWRSGPGTSEQTWLESISRVVYESGQVLLLDMQVHEPQSNVWISIARILAVMLVLCIAVKAIGELFKSSWRRWRVSAAARWLRWRRSRQLHLVCGLGRIGQRLAQDLLSEGHTVVTIDVQPTEHVVRGLERQGAIGVRGDAVDPQLLVDWGILRAHGVYLVTGDDLTNIEALAEIRLMLSRQQRALAEEGDRASDRSDGPSRLQCLIHVADRQLEQSLDHRLSMPGDPLELIPFNIYDRAARQWIKEHMTPARPRSADEVGLVVIFGFGKFAQSLLKNLVELAHFENRKRLRIVVFDSELQQPAKLFLGRWPQLSPHQIGDDPSQVTFDPADDEWGGKSKRPPVRFQVEDSRAIEFAANVHFCERTGQVADRAVVDAVARLCSQPAVCPFVVVGFDHDDQNYAVGVDLHSQLKRFYGINESAARTLPIYAYLPYSEALQQSLIGREPFPLIGFSDCRHSISLQSLKNRLAEELARVIALDYRKRYSAGLADLSATDLASARSRTLWNELAEWERAANLKAAEHALIKLQMLGFRLSEQPSGTKLLPPPDFDRQSDAFMQKVSLLSEVEHYRYVAERLMDGWQWAETKSQTPPRRPNLCTIAELHQLTRNHPQYALEWQKDWTQLQAVLHHLQSSGVILETAPSERDGADVAR